MSKISNVRAKFICYEVADQMEQVVVSMSAVSGNSEEDKVFSKWTPVGQLEIHISKGTPAATFFKTGQSYFFDITEENGELHSDVKEEEPVKSELTEEELTDELMDFLENTKRGKEMTRNWNNTNEFLMTLTKPGREMFLKAVRKIAEREE